MPAGIYFHIPFCETRCTYCNFNIALWDESLARRYADALLVEIERESFGAGEPMIGVDTISFGGGTPSSISGGDLVRIVEKCRGSFITHEPLEISVEVNPGTLFPEKLAAYRRAGVNRVSVGVQSFDDAELKSLSRTHTAADACATIRLLREEGFNNLNIDLIAGLPGQSLEVWRENIEKTIDLGIQHVSVYLLELQERTRMHSLVKHGLIATPDDERAIEMYYELVDALAGAGFEHYEISNFARRAEPVEPSPFRSRHNLKYWTDQPYWGFGCGAHGYDLVSRWSNLKSAREYADRLLRGQSAIAERLPISAKERLQDAAFLGLRLPEGIGLTRFREMYGSDLLCEFESELAEVFDAGLLEVENGRLKLTRRGLVLSNEVFACFV